MRRMSTRDVRYGLRRCRLAGVALVCMAASGCAGNRIGEEWQCPMVQGVPCQSVVEADPAGPEGAGGAGARHGAGTRQAVAAPPGANAADVPAQGEPVRAKEADSANLRTPEVIGRIWIAPYVDDAGMYHEAAWVRVVIEPARWRLP